MKRLALLIAGLSAICCQARVSLPDIIGPNMVLQQNTGARLWGWATPAAAIDVRTSWTGDRAFNAVADRDGRWSVTLPTPAASFEPQTVTIKGDGSDITLDNVLIGEVWFASGQSNMEMPLRGFGNQPVEGSAQAIAYSGKYPYIRMATIDKWGDYQLQDRAPGRWMVSNPDNAPEFSAVGYFFARSLSDILNVPVGIICSAFGGSDVESWEPRHIVDTYPEYDVEGERTGARPVDEWHRAVVRYNAMLNPVADYTVRGFIWNQGESNVGRHDTFPAHMADMVQAWRDRWGLGELPFYQVEIPGWHYGNPDDTGAALLREAQHRSAQIIPNCDIVCTSDLIYPYELEDIHARQKQPIGERLAFMAAARTYGYKTIAHEYPRLTDYRVNGREARLRFDNVGNCLSPNDVMDGFEVAGTDRTFVPVQAVVDPVNNDVVITAPDGVDSIESVRYCFKNFAIGSVHSAQGLPMVPFRTDDWDH